ncbi:MAG: dTDP-4-dehydrorhamnose reductase [Peptococcaceae bacterium]|nr:dTDP-4-dehydrorhamnose reductase [Peptococcaceae bacterium]
MSEILITGCKGMLGSDLAQAGVALRHDIWACGTEQFDITDKSSAYQYIASRKPKIIIHSAAYTDVDLCEKNRERAYNVNVLGTSNLVTISRQLDIALLFFSTDYIFDGSNSSGYEESAEGKPVNYYGETKLEAERIISRELEKYWIVRTSWLFGQNGRNFVKTIVNKAKETTELSVVDDQVGSPTFTKDLAKATFGLISDPAAEYGIYHITNSEYCTWYEFAETILKEQNLGCQLTPIQSKDLNRAAIRPSCSILKNNKWLKLGYAPLRSYKSALKDYLRLL